MQDIPIVVIIATFDRIRDSMQRSSSIIVCEFKGTNVSDHKLRLSVVSEYRKLTMH